MANVEGAYLAEPKFADKPTGSAIDTVVDAAAASVKAKQPSSGAGTGGGGGKSKTAHALKDAEVGGSLPENEKDLQKAVDAKNKDSSKIVGGSIVPVVGVPRIRGGDNISVKGTGRFDGTYQVETHTLTVSSSGVQSSIELTRNAVGKSSGSSGGGGGGGSEKPSDTLTDAGNNNPTKSKEPVPPKKLNINELQDLAGV